MNCVGKENIAHFLCMLLSLSLTLCYGVYLAYTILTDSIQRHTLRRANGVDSRAHWSSGKSWSQYLSSWGWALSADFRVGGIGLLALLTAPLAWGMFLYHIYLIWAGMTTNESSKWSEWKDNIAEGLVYKRTNGPLLVDEISFEAEAEPFNDWPVSSSQRLFRSEDGKSPPSSKAQNISSLAPGVSQLSPLWEPVHGLHEVQNLYDLGFWDNLKDVFLMR